MSCNTIDLGNDLLLWTPTSKNPKTGNIPQGYVGHTYKEADASCKGCALWDVCYYRKGAARIAHAAMIRLFQRFMGKRSTLEHAIKHSIRTARMIRLAVGGDPCVLPRKTLQSIINSARSASMGVLGYTHFPLGKGKHLKGLLMGSCDMDNVDEAHSIGWDCTVSLPVRDPRSRKHKHLPVHIPGTKYTTPKGKRILVCPEQENYSNNPTDCNHCKLCAVAGRKNTPIIGFLMH